MLAFVVFALVAFWVARWLKRVLAEPAHRPPHGRWPAQLPSTPVAACVVCGTYVPLHEALKTADGRIACCEAHRHTVDG